MRSHLSSGKAVSLEIVDNFLKVKLVSFKSFEVDDGLLVGI